MTKLNETEKALRAAGFQRVIVFPELDDIIVPGAHPAKVIAALDAAGITATVERYANGPDIQVTI